MDLLQYIEKGGMIVYILIALNFIGFTIIIFKFFVLTQSKKITKTVCEKLKNNTPKDIEYAVNYEIKSLESGLNFIKNIATISPLLGLLGTVIGVLKSFEAITANGLGEPSIFSNGISIALITTVAGLIVAIPHHLFYNYFISLLDNLEINIKNEITNI